MAEWTRDGGVGECKGFSPLNVLTTSASSTRLLRGYLDLNTRVPNTGTTTSASPTRLPLISLDLNTRVPNTGTATPQRLRRTELQRSADLPRKRARYAQKTKGQRLHDAHEIRTSGGSFLQHLGGASPAASEHGSLSVIGLC